MNYFPKVFDPSTTRGLLGLAFALHATWLPLMAAAATGNAVDGSIPSAKVTPPLAAASRSSKRFNEAQYAKAGELTVRPSPIDEIRVPSPDKANGKTAVTTRVTLFVDESGSVAKIGFDDPALAPPFRDAIKTAFGKARFKPGRIGTRPVKARMRIEVTFEPRSQSDVRAENGEGPK